MTKVYTRSGDDGFTTLADGERVKKCSDIVELYGCIEELNVFLGYVVESLCTEQKFQDLLKQIYRIQGELFELAAQLQAKNRCAIDPHKISKLELEIDAISDQLPVLQSFVLPSGGEPALRLYLARAVCRRAERVAFKLVATNNNAEIIGVYFNRLADWLYVAARITAAFTNIEETTFVS